MTDNANELSRDIAFPLVVGFREMTGIATKNYKQVSYKSSMHILSQVSPDLYQQVSKTLGYRYENPTLIYFKEIAAIEGKSVAILIQNEIDRQNAILQKGAYQKGRTFAIKRKIKELSSALDDIDNKVLLDEDTILIRDNFKVDKSDFGAKLIRIDDRFTDYKLANNSLLRVRLLHRHKAETSTGVDMIYEEHDVPKGKIRFSVFQYKIWNDRVLYKDARMIKQLRKMKTTFCDAGLCECKNKSNKEAYRMPYCSSFLRPTTQLQHANTALVTTGVHVPLCKALDILEERNLYRNDVMLNLINHHTFENLFNNGYIGSDWMSPDALEAIYKKSGILNNHDNLLIYARQEVEGKDSISDDDQFPF